MKKACTVDVKKYYAILLDSIKEIGLVPEDYSR